VTSAPTGAWRRATVRSIEHPSPRAVVLRLDVPDRIDHLPGQHYVIRLTADDGYVAQRSYSVASPPSDAQVEFYIERLDDGEVSTFLADVVEVGDELDVRGPIGGWFVWDADRPAVGLAGGSGAVPFVAMLRHARDRERTDLLRVAVSARTRRDVPYAAELDAAGVLVALTREDGPSRAAARLSGAEIAPLVPAEGPCFVCGSAAFAEAATDLLMSTGVEAARIRVERFGPTS
jgi:ferredoxin-NADP reductase